MAVRIKICGLRTLDMMAAALDAGADYVGLVFFGPSPRNVTFEEARPLADMARGRAKIVVLTVDADDALLDRIVGEIRPDILQLHGQETPERAAEIRERFGVEVMKVIKVATAEDAAEALRYDRAADMILFDARPPKGAVLPGGNGVPFDWHALEAVGGSVNFVLAGGLTPENVANAIRMTQAPAIDVSSGVETSPGVKDAGLIRAFITNARAADAQGEPTQTNAEQSSERTT